MNKLYLSTHKRLFLWNITFVLLTFAWPVYGAKVLYPTSSIPDNLKENAHCVVRSYKQTITIKSEKSSTLNIEEVITVLNKNGIMDATFKYMTNSFVQLSSFSGKIYNSDGKQIKSLFFSDVNDESFIDYGTMYSQDRIKYLRPENATYPYTVEYKYTVDLKQTFFIPTWAVDNINISYEQTECKVITPLDYKLNYKEYNITNPASISNNGKEKTYIWTIKNLLANRDEDYSDYTKPNIPLIRFSSDNFVFKGTTGSLKSWKEFGQWTFELIEDKNSLPETTVTKLKELTSNCTTEYEKVKVLYEYMQKKTRYVSIQIGLGGYEPFPATMVDETSYGDCKALSNYMKSLLEAVGIKSYYTLIMAGSNSNITDIDFPSNQFNHAILFVPLQNDSIWLECTSQQFPCGYIGKFTDDRYALVIKDSTSQLVKTKAYSADENLISRNYNVKLESITAGTAEVVSNYSGVNYEKIFQIYYTPNKDMKEKMILNTIELPTFNLVNYNYTENKDRIPSFKEELKLNFQNYIKSLPGDIYLLPLNFMGNSIDIPEKNRNRKSDVYIRRNYKEKSIVTFELPSGYITKEIPTATKIESPYGIYQQKIRLEDGKVIFERNFELHKAQFPANEYNKFRDFSEKVVTADNVMIQIVKQ